MLSSQFSILQFGDQVRVWLPRGSEDVGKAVLWFKLEEDMKKSKFTEGQIVRILHEASLGRRPSPVQDLTSGKNKNGRPGIGLGSVKPDGSMKHGLSMSEKVKDLFRNNSQVMKKIGKAAGRYGLYADVLTTSFDAAFLSDPRELGDMIDYVGGDWELIQGSITVSGT